MSTTDDKTFVFGDVYIEDSIVQGTQVMTISEMSTDGSVRTDDHRTVHEMPALELCLAEVVEPIDDAITAIPMMLSSRVPEPVTTAVDEVLLSFITQKS